MDTEPNEIKERTCPHRKHRHPHHKFMMFVIMALIVSGVILHHIHHKNPHHFHHRNSENSMLPKPGTLCTIRFRPDVLGASASPLTDNANGINLNFAGKLVSITPEYVVLQREEENITNNGIYPVKNCWIPKQNILMFEYREPDTQNRSRDQ